MRRMKTSAWISLVMCLLAVPALACLWDYDTLRDERRGLPGVAEVLAGKWERHSASFYRHRVERMKQLLASDPGNLAAYDNLAVAHEKLGDPETAIAVMERKEAVKPGEYTTAANLGTFYLHQGDLDNGIRHIERALTINPDAHFGREEYQLRLARYLRDIRTSGGPHPPEDFLGLSYLVVDADGSVAASPLIAIGRPDQLAERGLKPNVFDGVVGMIRFGTGKSPDLFYALGNLLVLRGDKHLAYRAYQRAIEYEHPRAADIAILAERVHTYISSEQSASAKTIEREHADADAWVAAYQQFEDGLIRAGKDVEDESNYAAFYAEHGAARTALGFEWADVLPRDPALRGVGGVLAVLGAAALAGILACRWFIRRRRRRHPPHAVT